MSNHGRHGFVAERRDQAERFSHGVQRAVVAVALEGVVPAGREAVSPEVGGNHVIARRGQRHHHVSPAVGELRKPVEQQKGRPVPAFETGLERVDREPVDVAHEPGPDARMLLGLLVLDPAGHLPIRGLLNGRTASRDSDGRREGGGDQALHHSAA